MATALAMASAWNIIEYYAGLWRWRLVQRSLWVLSWNAAQARRPFETAPGTVIEFVRGDFDRLSQIGRYLGSALPALIQGGLEGTDAFFHCAVIAGKAGWIV